MTELDKMGFIVERPLPPTKWGEFFKGSPPGRMIANNTIPPGMLVIQNFLDPSWCDAIVKECEALEGNRHKTGSSSNGTNLEVVESEARTSEAIGIDEISLDVLGEFRNVYANVMQPHFQVKLEWFEKPEILRYRDGGEYIVHSDAYNWKKDQHKWSRAIDRDLSVLLYLNSEFEGGEVWFPNSNFQIKPSRGTLVAFPSDWRYTHAAKPVTSGVRYVIVSWSAAVGSPRVSTVPPYGAIRF